MAGRPHHFFYTVKQQWLFLIGHPTDFALEARIFHSITLSVSFLAVMYAPYDLFAGLHTAAVSYVIGSCIFFYEYYRSRFLRHPHRSIVFGVAGLVLLSVNYFANAGIIGSTDLIWPIYLLLLLTICPYRHMPTWVIIYVVVFGVVHLMEQEYPELVQYPFQVGKGQFQDRITTFPIPAISIAIIIGLFRRNYDKERKIVARRDAEKSRLLSLLSHDLRVPFIQIQQYCELLADNTLSATDRTKVEQALKHKNDQTLDLVTNLLYWSRSQLDGFAIHLASLDLLSVLKNTLDTGEELSREKGIDFTCTIDPETKVVADANMLQLVVRNLLQNAIKFTPAGGFVRVESEIMYDVCRLSISDNGTGISTEQIDHIFSGTIPAFGTANEKGVGLGLQLCKEFMERQGGRIYVESVLEKGSRFTIWIPLN